MMRLTGVNYFLDHFSQTSTSVPSMPVDANTCAVTSRAHMSANARPGIGYTTTRRTVLVRQGHFTCRTHRVKIAPGLLCRILTVCTRDLLVLHINWSMSPAPGPVNAGDTAAVGEPEIHYIPSIYGVKVTLVV